MTTAPQNTVPTFTPPGGSGLQTVSNGRAVTNLLLPNGQMLVVGDTTSGQDFSVLRLNADGSVDTSFGTDGLVRYDVSGSNDVVYDAVRLADGKILIAGYSTYSDWNRGTDSTIMRLNADGSLDTSFGDWVNSADHAQGRTGSTVLNVGGSVYGSRTLDEARALTVQSDGKIVLAGSVFLNNPGNTNKSPTYIGMVRLTADGQLDNSFDDDGMALLTHTSMPWEYKIDAQSVIVLSDGQLLVGGTAKNSATDSMDFLLMRLNANGGLDRSFGDWIDPEDPSQGRSGMAMSPAYGSSNAYAMAVQADGKIVMVGGAKTSGQSTDRDFGILRFNADGTLDNTFGTLVDEHNPLLGRTGRQWVDLGGDDWAYALALQSDGKILVTGSGFRVLRLNTDGTPDMGFGPNGTGVVDLSLGGSVYDGEEASSITVLTDGRILLTGFQGQFIYGDTYSVMRLNADGSLDRTFNVPAGSTPVSTLAGSTASYTEHGSAVVLDADVAVFDAEMAARGSYEGAMLWLRRSGGPVAEDVFGSGHFVAVGATNGHITVDSFVIGDYIQAGTGDLLLYFNANANQARLDKALQSLTYANTSHAPQASVSIEWAFYDDKNQVSPTGLTTVSVTGVNDDPTGAVTISGTPNLGQTLTADASAVHDLDGLGAFGWQWLRDGTAVQGATGASYQLGEDDVSQPISVRISYTDGQGTLETVTSAQTVPIIRPNVLPTGAVILTGNAEQGQTLTADLSTLTDADGMTGAVFSYQWQRDGTAIQGATGPSHQLGQADVDHVIRVRVSYVDDRGTQEWVYSGATGQVLNVNDAPAGRPTVSGTAAQGQTLMADASGIVDADGLGALAWQWLRDGIEIAGATGDSYALTQADVGASIGVRVSYVDGFGADESVDSVFTDPVANVNDLPTGRPTISGTAAQGQTLMADASGIDDGDGLGAFAWQWLRDGIEIAGATGDSYALTQADVGASIGVRVSYVDGFGADESVDSVFTDPVANVNDLPTGRPTISGTAAQGQTLMADASSIADVDGLGAFAWQWLRDGAPIVGANAGSYTLTQADVGKAIGARVSYIDGQGSSESLESEPTGTVANVNDPPAGRPVIRGTAAQNQQLIVETDGIGDADGMASGFSYQWLRDGRPIAGAIRDSYTLTQADVGKAIGVSVYYTDGYGENESAAALPTIPVANVNDAPTTRPVTLAPLASNSGPRLITQADLLANAEDADGDALTVSHLAIVTGQGTLQDNGDGTWLYTPAAHDDRSVRFGYTISDAAESVAGTASLDITPQPSPEATADVDWVSHDGPRSDYVLMQGDDGVWRLRHADSGSFTPLAGIERLVFGDGAVALDLASGALAEHAARLVFTLWGPSGLKDPTLMGEVIAYVDALGLEQVAAVADGLGLLTARAGGPELSDMLALMHKHIVGRAPDAIELQALLDFQAQGAYSNAELLSIAAGLDLTAAAMDLPRLMREGLSFTRYEGPLFGSTAGESFRAQQGNDHFEAGAGIDTVSYGGDADGYAWLRESDGTWTVLGEEHDGGQDWFRDVERLQFADHAVALDLQGNAGAAVRLLAAAKGSHALEDRSLVGEVLSYVDARGAQGLAHDAQASGLLDALAGSDSMEALISLLYRNVAGHAPSEVDMQWTLALAEQQQWDRADLLLYAAELEQTAALIDLPALAGQGVAYDPWLG